MKKLFLFILLSIFLYQFSFAQEHQRIKRCGTMEYLELQKKSDTTLEARRQKIEKETQKWIKENKDNINSTKIIITIPVVVHVVYQTTAQNITDAQIYSQIDVLNEDFRRQNADASITPSIFQSVAADCELEFRLAVRTPNGQWTTGITRTLTAKSSFSYGADDVKFASTLGHDIWDRNNYLNIWVCNLDGGLLGYTQFPGGPAITDGVVVLYNAFGRIGNLLPVYNKGRSCTHEVGHWFNLYHVWGDFGSNCYDTDEVDDTPNQDDENYYCPTFPESSCGNISDMFMNYMDYTDDECMNIFTHGQKERMYACLNGFRSPIKSSNGCIQNGISKSDIVKDISIFPNPVNEIMNLNIVLLDNDDISITIHDMFGKEIYNVSKKNLSNLNLEINLSAYSAGMYFVRILTKNQLITKKISVIK